ncbi:MAG: ABC-2 type transport system permease protein [Chlamydiales bacterium]|jgi:ABC-2 type transport system permease protein
MIRLELLKLLRSRRPWIAIGALGLFLGLMLLGFYFYAQEQTSGEVEFRYTFENRSYFNGLTFAVYSFHFGCMLLLPIFLATEGGAQIAGETTRGGLYLLLTRPLSKSRILLSKLSVSAMYGAALVGGFLLICLLLGLFAVGWGDLRLYPGVLQMTPTPQRIEQSEALWRFFMIWPAASLAMLVPLTFSYLLSTIMRSPVNAASSAVSMFLVLHVISGVPFFAQLRPYLFTTHMGFWRGLLQESIPWTDVGHDAAKLAANGLLFLALAHGRFRRREEV